MIINHIFFLFSCALFQRNTYIEVKSDEIDTFFSLELSIEELERLIRDIEHKDFLNKMDHQQLAQLYWLNGLKKQDPVDWVQSRSHALQCLSEDHSFSIEFLRQEELDWRIHSTDRFWDTKECLKEKQSSILDLPNQSVFIACSTWSILSWSKLIGFYGMEGASVDSEHVLYLSAWLSEHQGCLSTPWISYALALGMAQVVGLQQRDVNLPFSMKELLKQAKIRLEDLHENRFAHPYVLMDNLHFITLREETEQNVFQRWIEEVDSVLEGDHPLDHQSFSNIQHRLRELKQNLQVKKLVDRATDLDDSQP